MNILMVSPTVFPDLTGDAVSAHRIAEGLRKLGHEVHVITPSDDVGPLQPHVVHALHAFKSARAAILAKKFNVPLVVTMTGTDGNRDINDPQKRLVIAEVLFQAAAVVFYSDILKAKVVAEFPKIAEKALTIPKGMPILPDSEFQLRKALKLDENAILFTLVGSIRPVKNTLFAIAPLEKLHQQNPQVHLIVVGTILEDPEYGKKIMESLSGKSWAKYLENATREQIRQVYIESDVIVNCSLSESESNAIIEAMILGKTLLASDIDPNAALIGSAGVTYRAGDADDFFRKAKALAEGKKDAFGDLAKQAILRKLNPLEAEDYVRVYEHAASEHLGR